MLSTQINNQSVLHQQLWQIARSKWSRDAAKTVENVQNNRYEDVYVGSANSSSIFEPSQKSIDKHDRLAGIFGFSRDNTKFSKEATESMHSSGAASCQLHKAVGKAFKNPRNTLSYHSNSIPYTKEAARNKIDQNPSIINKYRPSGLMNILDGFLNFTSLMFV